MPSFVHYVEVLGLLAVLVGLGEVGELSLLALNNLINLLPTLALEYANRLFEEISPLIPTLALILVLIFFV